MVSDISITEQGRVIRIFQKKDCLQLQKMIQKTIQVSYPAYYPDRAVRFFLDYHSEANIAQRYQHGQILVLEHDGNIVATGSLVENEISGVFVLPSHQSRGFGKQIMRELEVRAQKQGVEEIELHVSMPSRKFYEILQYMISKPLHLDVGDGQYLKYWQGKKSISI